MNNITTEDNVNIKDLIYTIRGKQVMLDSDVAMLYHYDTKRINETVKRNLKRFPEEFCFKLTHEEYMSLFDRCNMWSQIATAKTGKYNKIENRGGRRNLPYVFTEQGIAMLSGLLKSDIAINVSIKIMDAFVEMRKFLMINGNIFERLTNVEYKMLDYDKKFDYLFNQFELGENIKQRIFFDGQIYDAYSLIVSIIEKSNKSILIIDNYVDKSVLDMLSKKRSNVKVKIITGESCKLKEIDIDKFNKEYPSLEVIKTNKFHDRFIIIDETEMYHLGSSIKDAGNKIFGINKIEDKYLIDRIINYIN